MTIYKDIYRGVLYDLQGNALPGPSTGPAPLVGFNTYLDNLDPGYTLEFGDAAAACVDSSSAGNDFTITGGSYSRSAAGASAMFSGVGDGYVDSVTALCKSDVNGIASSGGFTIGFVWLVESNPSSNFRFFDNQDTGAPTVGRTLFYQTPSGLAGLHGTTFRHTA